MGHVGIDNAGLDDGHAYIERSQLLRERLAQRLQGELGPAVDCHGREQILPATDAMLIMGPLPRPRIGRITD
jgi:hypothetical protein